MINLEDLVSQIQTTKTSLKEMEGKLQNIQVTSEAGAGLVKVTMNGQRKVLNIDIDETLLQTTNKTMLQDLIIAAVNLTLEKLEENIKKEVGQVTALPNLLQDLL